MCENRCVHRAQIFLFLVSQGDNWESAACVSFVCVPAAFVWVSLLTFYWLYLSAQTTFSRLISSPEACRGSGVMIVIFYHLSSSQQLVTSVSKLTLHPTSSSLLLFSMSLSTSQSPAAVFSPTKWGWKGGVFVFKTKQFTDGWRGVNLYGCDKPRFLPQQHSKPMWKSCSVCCQREHLLKKLLTSFNGHVYTDSWILIFTRLRQ